MRRVTFLLIPGLMMASTAAASESVSGQDGDSTGAILGLDLRHHPTELSLDV